MPALSTYKSVETALLVKIELPEGAIRYSDYNTTLALEGEIYQGLGKLVGITNTTSELRISNDTLTLTISGIPDSSLQSLTNSKMKGSNVSVYRVLFDPVTKQPLDVPNPIVGRFFGVVNNYSLDEEWDYSTRTSSNTVAIICSSLVSVLEKKYSGRRTNDTDQKKLFPGDQSFDRITSLVNANFQFGAKA